MSNVHVWHH